MAPAVYHVTPITGSDDLRQQQQQQGHYLWPAMTYLDYKNLPVKTTKINI